MFDYQIIEHVATVDNGKNGSLELNHVIVNGKSRLYDLGSWTPEGERRGGILMTYTQLSEFKKILCDI